MSETRFEMLVGIEVTDGAAYAQYRAAMMPLLRESGGFFACDFQVGAVLPDDVDPDINPQINRAFVLSFPHTNARDAFFGGPEYQAAKAQYFDGAVGSVSVLGTYQTTATAQGAL